MGSINNIQNEKLSYIEKVTNFIKSTPFHPQWLIFRDNYKSLLALSNYIKGNTLDIGCSNKAAKKYLPDGCHYIGLDYYRTAIEWYETLPEVYGDAQNLPLISKSIETVLLLDVLEHLHDPEECLREINRVLVDDGVLIIQVPFIYPIHDAPLDFNRWTQFGLRKLIHAHGFNIIEEKHKGDPLETAGIIINIAMTKTILNWIKQKNPAALIALLMPIFILITNILAKLLGFISQPDTLMPWGYRLVVIKNNDAYRDSYNFVPDR